MAPFPLSPPPFPIPPPHQKENRQARKRPGSERQCLGALGRFEGLRSGYTAASSGAARTSARRRLVRSRGALLAQTRGGDSRTSARRPHSYVRARRYRTHPRWRQSYAREAARAVQRRPEGSDLGRLSVRVQPAFPPSRHPSPPPRPPTSRSPFRSFPSRVPARLPGRPGALFCRTPSPRPLGPARLPSRPLSHPGPARKNGRQKAHFSFFSKTFPVLDGPIRPRFTSPKSCPVSQLVIKGGPGT